MHGDDSILLVLTVLLFFALIIVPILAISAFVRVRRLERDQRPAGPDPSLIARVYQLEQQVAALAARVGKLTSAAPAAERPPSAGEAPPVRLTGTVLVPPTPPPTPQPAARPSPPVPPPILPSMLAPGAPARKREDMETQIAGRWLNRIGILIVTMGVAFFLKYAIDNHWIGPTGQVAIGILLGAALVASSQWFLQRGYVYFSEGMAGLGAAVLYLSLWAGSNYYHLFSLDMAFVAMIAVTGAMIAVAVGRNSQRIALLAMAGGFITPMLVSTGKDAQVILFTYVAVLDASLLAVARARDWRIIEGFAFLFTQAYFWGWYDRFYGSEKLLRTSAYATLFFGVFTALPMIRSRRTGRLYNEQVLLVLLNAGAFLLALRAMLWPDHRWTLTLAALALAALHLVVLQSLPRVEEKGEGTPVYLLFAGLALTFVTLAIPICVDGRWITIAWAVEGAVLVWSGFHIGRLFLRGTGLLLLGIAAFRILILSDWRTAVAHLLVNERFGTFAVVIAACAVAFYFSRQNAEAVEDRERGPYLLLGVGVNVLALWALSLELLDYYSPYRPATNIEDFLARSNAQVNAHLAQQLSLTLLWTVYASALLFFGMRRAEPGLRWQGLALFGVTIVKVFVSDFGFLQGFYRIASSIALGVVLLIVSFLYQKKLASEKPGEGS